MDHFLEFIIHRELPKNNHMNTEISDFSWSGKSRGRFFFLFFPQAIPSTYEITVMRASATNYFGRFECLELGALINSVNQAHNSPLLPGVKEENY